MTVGHCCVLLRLCLEEVQSGNGEAVSSTEKQSCSVEVYKLGFCWITECGLENPAHLLSPLLFSFGELLTRKISFIKAKK